MKWIVAIVLIAELAACTWLAGMMALGQISIPQNLALPAYSVLFGGIGGCVYCLRGVYLNASVYKRWDNGWLIWYFIRPIISCVLGGVSYLFVNSGLLLLGASRDPQASQLGIWALAFLAGLNVDKFLSKVEGIGHSVWGVDPSRQSRQPEVAQSDPLAEKKGG
jgi:hypothetical protein